MKVALSILLLASLCNAQPLTVSELAWPNNNVGTSTNGPVIVDTNLVTFAQGWVTSASLASTNISGSGIHDSTTISQGGCEFICNSNITVTALGRYVLSGSTGRHQLALQGGSVTAVVYMNASTGVVGQFTYTTIPGGATLSSGQTYTLSSTENSTSGGNFDPFYIGAYLGGDDPGCIVCAPYFGGVPCTTTTVGTILNVYWQNGALPYYTAATNMTMVPVSFIYH